MPVDNSVDNFGDLSTGSLIILYAFDRWRLPVLAPRELLQGRHAGRRFSMSSDPPSETGTIWSAVVAMNVQQSSRIEHGGLSSSISLRLAL